MYGGCGKAIILAGRSGESKQNGGVVVATGVVVAVDVAVVVAVGVELAKVEYPLGCP